MKAVTPVKEGLSNQVRMRAWKMGKEWRSPFHALRNICHRDAPQAEEG